MPLPNIREIAPMRVNAVATSGSSGVDGSPYYRDITVTEQSGTDLTDYQVRIDLDSSNFDFSHSTSDGSDVRITDDSDNKLSFWIEKWDSTNQEATIWVKVPSISANSSVTIRMYYGNTSLASESDGDSTFLFFDDFEVDLSKWTTIDGSPELSTSQVHSGSESVYINASSEDLKKTGLSLSKPVMLDVWAYDNNGASTSTAGMIALFDDASTAVLIGRDANSGSDTNYIYRIGDTYYDSGIARSDGWHHFQIFHTTDNQVKFYIDGSLAGSGSYSTTPSRVALGNLWSSDTADEYYDTCLVRKYADPEPSTSVGDEQALGGGIPSSSRISNTAR